MSRLISRTGFTFERSIAPPSTRTLSAACRRLDRGEEIRALVLEVLRVGEPHEADPPALALARRHRAVRARCCAAFLGADGDRAALPQDDMAVARDELAAGVDLEGTVAGVALARRGLHGEECVAPDRGVERIARRLDRSAAQVERRPGVDHVGQLLIGTRKGVGACSRHQIFAEARVARLESVRRDVRHVVGDHVELTAERRLTRQADEKRVLHEPLPSVIPSGPRRSPARTRHRVNAESVPMSGLCIFSCWVKCLDLGCATAGQSRNETAAKTTRQNLPA